MNVLDDASVAVLLKRPTTDDHDTHRSQPSPA